MNYSQRLTTPDELHQWIRQHLELNIPRRPVCPGHAAPFDYLRHAYFEPSPDMVVWAPRGGGKTRLAAIATLLDLLHKPGLSVCILGGSLDQSRHIWTHLLDDMDRLDIELPRALNRRIKLASGSIATILAQSQTSVRGHRVQKLRCDEVDLFDADILEAAQLITRSRDLLCPGTGDNSTAVPLAVRGAVELISTYQKPVGPMSQQVRLARAAGRPVLRWCLMEVLERCPPERSCDGCPLWEECRGIAKTACEGHFIIDDAIAMKQRVSQETWLSELLCRRPLVRGRVFASFDRKIHVRSADTTSHSDAAISLGIDFGYANPFVCLWVQTRGTVVHVVDEYVQREQMLEYHIEQIRQRTRWGDVRRIHCDPAGGSRNEQTAQSNIQLLQKRGYRVYRRSSRIVDGLELIRSALKPAWGPPRLFVDPACVRLIEALESYRYPDRGGEIPLKDGTFDHPLDALRYWFINSQSTGRTEVIRY